jgi:hypothetical protein
VLGRSRQMKTCMTLPVPADYAHIRGGAAEWGRWLSAMHASDTSAGTRALGPCDRHVCHASSPSPPLFGGGVEECRLKLAHRACMMDRLKQRVSANGAYFFRPPGCRSHGTWRLPYATRSCTLCSLRQSVLTCV